MEEVQQPVLMLVYRDPELVDVIAKIVNLRTPCLVAGILQILQRTTDLRPMCRNLRSDVVQCRLIPASRLIELEPIDHRSYNTAYRLLYQGA